MTGAPHHQLIFQEMGEIQRAYVIGRRLRLGDTAEDLARIYAIPKKEVSAFAGRFRRFENRRRKAR